MPGLYFRTISIYRPMPAEDANANLQVGLVSYSGLAAENEILRFSDIPASIQAKSIGNTRNTDLPAGSPGPVKWVIFLPKSSLAIGSVEDQDIVVDDLGERYQVASAYFNLLGYKLDTVKTAHAEVG